MGTLLDMQSSASRTTKHRRKVLILGGTGEASQLATCLAGVADWSVISSLAGRVRQPSLPEGRVRVGGFGGVDGLRAYLVQERVDVVVDATHPFASTISHNAESACHSAHVPLISFERPAWTAKDGDRWLPVPDVKHAASLVNRRQNRVFLSIGRQELHAFSDCKDAWFLVRSIDEPICRLPAHSKVLLERGPFSLTEERQMLRQELIGFLVSKNSGGAATYAKIEAARELQIPVVMIDRPVKHKTPTVARLEDVLLSLEQIL